MKVAIIIERYDISLGGAEWLVYELASALCRLGVEVEIRDGEEFEGLKRAFNEMLRSISKIIDGLYSK